MDYYVKLALKAFYYNPEGFDTDEFYREYLRRCVEDQVKPKSKSFVIKTVCAETGLRIEERRIKYFRR